MMKQLNARIKFDKEWRKLDDKTECHLDPGIYPEVISKDAKLETLFWANKKSQPLAELRGMNPV